MRSFRERTGAPRRKPRTRASFEVPSSFANICPLCKHHVEQGPFDTYCERRRIQDPHKYSCFAFTGNKKRNHKIRSEVRKIRL